MTRITFAASLVLLGFSAVGFGAPFGHGHCRNEDHYEHHHHGHHHHGHHDHFHGTGCSLHPGGCHSPPLLPPAHDVPFIPEAPEAHIPPSSGPEIHSHLPNLEDALGLATGGSLLGIEQESQVDQSISGSRPAGPGPSDTYIGPEEQLGTPDDSFTIQGDVDIDDADDDDDEAGDDDDE